MKAVDKQIPMDARRLAIFLAVVDEGGFTRAGDALEMSQPAVSQAVRELEAALGTMLFHRIGRGVRLTPAGEALVLPARQVHRDIQNARLAVGEIAGLEAGRLDIGCLPTLAAAPLAPLVGAFRAAHPDVAIVLADPQDTADLLEFVRLGRCEIGLVGDVATDDLSVVGMGVQDFLVVLPPGTECSDPLPARRLATMPLVAAPPGSSTRGLLDDTLRRAGGVARVVVETAQREALLPLIASGAGAGLLPQPLAEMAALLGCVVARPSPPVARPVALIHRRAPLTPAAQRFIALATEPNKQRETVPCG
jgi:DNA-binding transcriptional LysR family regulator